VFCLVFPAFRCVKRGFVRKWEDFELFWFGAALRNR
jgi:hypothetical protein